jgi:type II secretory pathway pseudopilin PulG
VLIVEMLATFAIVSVTLVIVANSFISANKGNAVTQRAVEVADALSYMLADMTREAKVSEGYSWDSNTSKFSMTHVDGLNEQDRDTVSYALVGGSIRKTVTDFTTGESVTLPITPATIFNATSFGVTILDTGGVRRATVTLTARHVDAKAGEPSVHIHTTLTERLY